jgi:tRNA-uridine 2-sulfurtransferase
MKKKCVVMFSGGLDSTIAVHLMQQQQIEVLALHFVLPFESSLEKTHDPIIRFAQKLSVPLHIEEEGEEYLPFVKTPRFGYGKNCNPCVDCRIHRLKKAKEIMLKTGAEFIVTGEVIGQRPMSQRRDCLDIIEKQSGLRGILLRPLSAQRLKPTHPELDGTVDRQRLLSIWGRGRKQQIAYAGDFGLQYLPPAGGCILTQEQTARRFTDLKNHIPDFTLSDFKLLAWGRHFRITSECKLIVGRNERENHIITLLQQPSDAYFQIVDIAGPAALCRGIFGEAELHLAAQILTRYTKTPLSATAQVDIAHAYTRMRLTVTPADEPICDQHRI